MKPARRSSELLIVSLLRSIWGDGWYLAVLLVGVTLFAYLPAWNGTPVWDDDAHLIRPDLRSVSGLERIWTQLSATQQYYPLMHSAFWVQHRLWGDNYAGYHIVNILLHCGCALLLVCILQKLRVPGAWLAGALFALHPVQVESVAWMAELKNTLSGAFYLGAALAYLEFDRRRKDSPSPQKEVQSEECKVKNAGENGGGEGPPSPQKEVQSEECKVENAGENGGVEGEPSSSTRPSSLRGDGSVYYFLALLLFALALMTKTVICTLPAALLVVFWWQRGKLSGRKDVLPLIPFFIVGIASGLFTSWVERKYGGAEGKGFDLTPIERCLVAGRAFWFYLGKLFWPAHLTFIYPRWHISQTVGWQYLFPLLALLFIALLYLFSVRRWTLDVESSTFPLHHSISGLPTNPSIHQSTDAPEGRLARAPLAAVLFFAGTLFPALGFFNVYPFRFSFVADHFQYLASIGIFTLFAAGAVTLLGGRGSLLGAEMNNRPPSPQKEVQSEECKVENVGENGVRGEDTLFISCSVALLLILATLTWYYAGRFSDSETIWQSTLANNPDCFLAHNDFGLDLINRGQVNEALEHFRKAVEILPDYADAQNNLGDALLRRNQVDEALPHFQKAATLDPENAHFISNVGNALLQQNRIADALVQFRKAASVSTNDTYLLSNLAWVLATGAGTTPENHVEAVQVAEKANALTGQRAPWMIGTLAVAYAKAGRFTEAATTLQRAMDLAGPYLNNPAGASLRDHLNAAYQIVYVPSH